MEFAQEAITTLHAFDDPEPRVRGDRIAVVVPIMGDDLSRSTITHVLSSLGDVYLGRVILCVRADRSAVVQLQQQLDALSLDADLLWCNAPALESALEQDGVTAATGKGKDVWLGMGVAATTHDIIVVHDADSRAYQPSHVPRLAWPIDQGFEFAKGYYARIEDRRFYGRLVRLVWYPLLDVLRRRHTAPIVQYLSAFRYPLAGEFAIDASHIDTLQMYPQWGLETGMLAHMYDLAGFTGTAQVDLGHHRHDHRPVRGDSGLTDIAQCVVDTLLSELQSKEIAIDRTSLATAYEDAAASFVERYEHDATFNGLAYDRHDELDQVQSYAATITANESTNQPLPPFPEVHLTADDVERYSQAPDGRQGARRTP